MTRFQVSPTKDYLLKDGEPFFYLADTVWAAFGSLTSGRVGSLSCLSAAAGLHRLADQHSAGYA